MAVDDLLQENGDLILLESVAGHLLLESSTGTDGVSIEGEQSLQVLDVSGWTDQKLRRQHKCFIDVKGQIICHTKLVQTSRLIRRFNAQVESKIGIKAQLGTVSKLLRETAKESKARISRDSISHALFQMTETEHNEMLSKRIIDKVKETKKKSLKSLFDMYKDI